MINGVKDEQETAKPDATVSQTSDKARENFARLESAKQAEREARIRAEMERDMLKKQLETATRVEEKDPLDDVEDYVDKERLQQIRTKDRAAFKKEAEEIANRTYQARRDEEERRNFLPKLKQKFSDYDQVMNEQSIADLEQKSPEFLASVMRVSDDYERRLLTYEYLKASKEKQKAAPEVEKQKQTIMDRVEENQRNPYYLNGSSGSPTAIEFDVRSKSSRDAAYQKLKQAQRNPIGNPLR